MDITKEDRRRPFRPATVGACHAQTATDRFGDEAKRAVLDRERTSLGLNPSGLEWPIDWPGSESDDEYTNPVPVNSIYKLVPAMQTYRNNLTALSQKYNLYFVAYRGRIFVYVPRSVPNQRIPREPDLQLISPPSHVAPLVGGSLDPISPHTINHIIVGSLGQEEIVLTCYDDGDIVAYYTKYIADHIRCNSKLPSSAIPKHRRRPSTSTNPSIMPKPFFQENVGISAWGLAVHQKSRLIAVSSNRYEVTVFAPALASSESKSRYNCDCSACCDGVEAHVRRRARNWRIVVTLGPLGDNIPNISFVDDRYGNAEKIIAVDIKGAMWLADIWKPSQAAIRVMPSTSPLLKSEEFWPAASRGWGILALAKDSFLTVFSEEELLGAPLKDLELVPKLQAGPHPMVNVAKYIRDLPDNPCTQRGMRPPVLRPNNQGPQDAEPGVDVEAEDELHMSDDTGSDFGDSEPTDDEEIDEDDDEDEDDEDDDDDDDEDMEMAWDEMFGAAGDEEQELEIEPAMLYATTQLEATAVSSDIPPALQSQPEETSVETPVVHEALPGTSMVTLPLLGTAMSLQDLFTDLFTPPVESPLSGAQSTGNEYRLSPAPPSTYCLKLQPGKPLLDMIYLPHSGQVAEAPRHTVQLADFLQRPTESNDNTTGYVSGLGRFAERYHMLRMYEKDVEMRTLDKPNQKGLPEFGILCPYALTMGLSPGRAMRPYFRATSRLSMIAHIPELWLVVIGSPIGRVLLVTPTRLAAPVERWPGVLHHGLRIEWVLPRQSDEEVFRVSKRPLHGLAVGPVQEDCVVNSVDEMRKAAVPRRYRLMLHYRNHDILTYEITREEQTGKLCIF